MNGYALQIQNDKPGIYRWVILVSRTNPQRFEEFTSEDASFDTYADALDAGGLALAAADGMAYESEASDSPAEVAQ